MVVFNHSILLALKMLKRFQILLFFLFITKSFSQEFIEITLKSDHNDFLENVLITNNTIDQFSYTQEKGVGKIFYKDITDLIIFSLPGFKNRIISVNEIINLNNVVFLESKPESLKTIFLVAKKEPVHDLKYKRKAKKRYYTKVISSNAAIVSSYLHKVKKNKLIGISFYFNNKSLTDNEYLYIRPLIIVFDNSSEINLIENSSVIDLGNETEKITIDLTDYNLSLKKNKIYFIGFQLIDKNEIVKTINTRVLNLKNEYCLIKGSPNHDWFKQDVQGEGFSLDFELLLKE
jgi:hypothetical protein